MSTQLIIQMGNKEHSQYTSEQTQNAYIEQKMIGGQKLLRVGENQLTLSISHRSIGSLIFRTPNGSIGKGSGILISNNLVLTAAHNLVCKDTNKKHTGFRFYLAPNGIVEKYFQIESFMYPQEYESSQVQKKQLYDYGVLKLREDGIKVKHGVFCELFLTCFECVKIQGVKNLEELQFQIYGYPYDHSIPNYTPHDKKNNKIQLYQYGLSKAGKFVSIHQQLSVINYRISTLPGQSGCPVTSMNNIIAVHIGSSIAKQENIGRLITHELLDNLYLWSQQLKATSFAVNTKSICRHYQNKRAAIKKIPKTIEYQEKKVENVKQNIDQGEISQKKSIQTVQYLQNQGDKYFFDQNYEVALEKYLKCLAKVQKQKGKGCLESIRVLFSIGTMYLQQNNYSKTIDSFKECIRLCLRHNRKDRMYAYSQSNLGLAYIQIEDFKLAAQSFQQSINAYQRLNIPALTKTSATELAKCYKQLNQPKQLSQVLKKYDVRV